MTVIHIRENKTGVIVLHHEPESWLIIDTATEYMWTEGNYSCDCNRSILFGKKKTSKCGDSKFSIQAYGDEGTLLYDEF